MLKTLLLGLAVLSLTAFVGSGGTVHAGDFGCASQTAADGVALNVDSSKSDFGIVRKAASYDVYNGRLRLSQTLRTSPSGQSRLPRRVPSGQTFHIQLDGQRGFDSFSAGATLPTHDCVEVNCPASFPATNTCWRCIKQAE